MTTTLSCQGKFYNAVLYRTDASGVKTAVSLPLDAQTADHIKKLAQTLLNAHAAKATSPIEPKVIDQSGLMLANDSKISHDFTLQSASGEIAHEGTQRLTTLGHTAQETTVKAQDVWNALATLIDNRPAATSPPVRSPPRIETTRQRAPLSQGAVNTPPPESNPPPRETPPTQAFPLPPIHYSEIAQERIDYTQSDWYDQIPLRRKYRLINDIIIFRGTASLIYKKIWDLFTRKAQLNGIRVPTPLDVSNLLESERNRLERECRIHPTAIAQEIQTEANAIINIFYNRSRTSETTGMIERLMQKEFAYKESLLRIQREIAEKQGIASVDADRLNPHRFVQALMLWMDADHTA